ncbi:MAG: N-acetylglucosamine kinase [Pseudonocardiaceae bacterium]|nr:N-acetylglucosamine kinase [Pseudonocardiaceae bacterium]
MSYVLGVDAGATSTRAMVTDLDGQVLGNGRSGGGNPNAHPPEQAAGHIGEAITKALAGLEVAAVKAAVVGMAGTAKLTDPEVAAIFERAWRRVPCPVRLATDADVAFASATDEPDGTVLIAGTGSIAGRIRDRRLVSTVGGYGWLLGDEGSAFWVGRAAVRATLGALELIEPLGELARAVLAEAGVAVPDEEPDAHRQAWRELITAVNAQPPIQLARFAPLVSAAAQRDEQAAAIVTDAAGALVRTARQARDAEESTPVVLVGSVLGADSPVGQRVRAKLEALGIRVLGANDGVLGAVRLARESFSGL